MKVALVGKGDSNIAFALHDRTDIDRIIELRNVPVGEAYIVDPEEILLKDLSTGRVTRPLMELIGE